ncbi:MAG TPA: hypothetical protein VE993_16790, partial [Stellaceae bacterium]|nr:hypothetical protein [Stellaceae bacterium]
MTTPLVAGGAAPPIRGDRQAGNTLASAASLDPSWINLKHSRDIEAGISSAVGLNSEGGAVS